ncbi:MAG: elongation factor G, partial [Cellulomonadaceae bacterium]|nr:elongation factor G [Cellulomonadaceae bacterium]
MAKVAKDHIMAAVVGSAGSGMTTIVEAVLHRAGAIPRPGTIAEGNTVSDFQPEEVARQTTLTPSLTYLDWTDENGTDHAVTLADTPGHPDFIGGVDSVLSAADLAVIVVSAVAGVTAGTRAGWAAADAAGRPRIVLITCADRPQADFRKVLKDLRNSFGDHLFAVQLPIGEEENFTGIADVLSKRAMSLDANGKVFIKDLPSDIADEAEELHMEATENIVENDEDLMMAYLEGEEPSVEDLEKNLAEQVAAGNAVPVIVASGVTETGVDRFIDVLCRVQPQVSGRDFTIIADDGTEMKIAQDAEGEPILYCFQTVADKYGQVSVFRVLSGTVRKGDKLRNATTGTEERLGDLFRLRGSEHIEVDSLSAGDVGGVAKLKDTPAASLLWSRSERATAPALPTRAPVFSVVLKPATQAD